MSLILFFPFAVQAQSVPEDTSGMDSLAKQIEVLLNTQKQALVFVLPEESKSSSELSEILLNLDEKTELHSFLILVHSGSMKFVFGEQQSETYRQQYNGAAFAILYSLDETVSNESPTVVKQILSKTKLSEFLKALLPKEVSIGTKI